MKLTDQIKQRRQELDLQQKDMKLRIGMNQQQFQRIESGGNPRLNTLELVAEGLNAELLLVPKEKLRAVRALLQSTHTREVAADTSPGTDEDPWSGVLE